MKLKIVLFLLILLLFTVSDIFISYHKINDNQFILYCSIIIIGSLIGYLIAEIVYKDLNK